MIFHYNWTVHVYAIASFMIHTMWVRKEVSNNCVNLLTYITYVSIIFKLFIIIKYIIRKIEEEEEVGKDRRDEKSSRLVL